MRRVVIIGAGGHGREVADILRHQTRLGERHEVLGFIDDDLTLKGQIREGVPVLGDWRWFDGVDRNDLLVICAVGQPHIMRRLVQRALSTGLHFTNAVSPLSYISDFATIGQGVAIFPKVVVNTRAQIGDYTILNVGVSVSHDTIIGKYSAINPGAHLAGNVTVGEGCYIGMGTNAIQGRVIGPWTTVGAGAVITSDLPAGSTAVGVPARVIKMKDENWYE